MNKVAHYRRALWLAAGGPTLQHFLGLCLGACPEVDDTKFEYRSGTDAQISARSQVGDGIGIYLTLYTEGRRAATIQNGGPQVRRRAAPNGEEFLRTGIHLLVQGNHVSYVAEGHTNDGQITSLFHRFFQHCNRPVSDTQFALQPRADRAQIEALLAAGVKSIDLGMSAFETTVNDLNDAAPVGGIANRFRALIDAIQSIGGPDRSPEQIEAASEIQARVHLGYDGRTSNHLLPSLLATIASDVAESAGEFKILTNDDVLITHDKLVIKREVDVEGDDVAIESASAFAVLRDTMHGWRQAGIFDQ